jgi:hypothetical protein
MHAAWTMAVMAGVWGGVVAAAHATLEQYYCVDYCWRLCCGICML